ncbi:hypothetical protein BJ875DRAFT_415639 [Amylocarpus encephaloides]|uniref:PHD-type domain-containing protein n=1 Tax=Amylocarpus encephaloides TaxID=45428 RepID=A0A9P7YSB3_9HELO|nr:hypothetical protein BJ875DRAFT_415639 [Amylocarpus encephaloides]
MDAEQLTEALANVSTAGLQHEEDIDAHQEGGVLAAFGANSAQPAVVWPRPRPTGFAELAEPAAPVSNNKSSFKYKYLEAKPTPPGEDDAEWNKVYTAADSRFYNRNGKNADKSRKYRLSGETYELALKMMAEKKEKLRVGGSSKTAVGRPKAPKKQTPIIKTEPPGSSRDNTPGGDRIPMSLSEQIKIDGRARKAPSAAPSSQHGTPAPSTASKMGSPPPKMDKPPPPPKKKGTAAPIKKVGRPRGPGKPITQSNNAPQGADTRMSDSESNDGGEYCICRGPDDHRMMVNCEGGCDEWYHCSCINMDVEAARELLDRYICPRCAKMPGFQTSWKRMCRYHNVGKFINDPNLCKKAARVQEDAPSKYCSDEHRDAFFVFVRDRLARQDDAPSMGGRLNIHEVHDILNHSKNKADLQKLGQKPRLPVPEGYDPSRPIGLNYITPEEVEQLKIIEAKKAVIVGRIEGYVLQKKLLVMILERCQAAAAHPACEEKGLCGYDNRLSFNEYEFKHWVATTEGQAAFGAGKLGPRTDATKSISTRQFAPHQPKPAVPKVIDAFNNICMTKSKSCIKHRQWRVIHGQDYAHMSAELKKDLDKLNKQADEIIDDAETREAAKEYHAHNTVEQLF